MYTNKSNIMCIDKRPFTDKQSLLILIDKILEKEVVKNELNKEILIHLIFNNYESKSPEMFDILIFDNLFVLIANIKTRKDFTIDNSPHMVYFLRNTFLTVYIYVNALSLMLKYGWQFNKEHKIYTHIYSKFLNSFNGFFYNDALTNVQVLSYSKIRQDISDVIKDEIYTMNNLLYFNLHSLKNELKFVQEEK